jgi:hypothetical protein
MAPHILGSPIAYTTGHHGVSNRLIRVGGALARSVALPISQGRIAARVHGDLRRTEPFLVRRKTLVRRPIPRLRMIPYHLTTWGHIRHAERVHTCALRIL